MPDAERPDWLESVLRFQLAANPVTWETLQAHGVNAESSLRLDFAYDAPNEGAARTLSRFLAAETDYAVDATSSKPNLVAKRKWSVEGTTQPANLSAEIIDDWVTWMVLAGAEHGCCPFDGWVAAVVA